MAVSANLQAFQPLSLVSLVFQGQDGGLGTIITGVQKQEETAMPATTDARPAQPQQADSIRPELTRHLGLRVTLSEGDALTKLAWSQGLTASGYMRALIRKAIRDELVA